MEKRGMLRALRDDMRESKTLDFLLENAEVSEVDPAKFAPPAEEPAEAPAEAEAEEAAPEESSDE